MAILSKAFKDEFEHEKIGQQFGEAVDTTEKYAARQQEIANTLKMLAAQGDIDASKLLSALTNDLAMSELERNAPRVSRIQNQMDADQAASDVSNLNTYGKAIGQAMRETDSAANQEFYQNLGTLGNKYAEALGGLSPTMTAGQRAEMERGLARMNPNMADNSAVNLAEKAAEFGSAGQQQQMNFVNAINSISAALPSLKTGLNPAALALGRDSRSSPVAGAITPVVKPTTEGTDTARGMFSAALQGVSDINKMRAGAFKTWGDALQQDSESFSNIASGATSIAGASDVAIKEAIEPAPSVLEKIEALPVFEWQYKPWTNQPAGRHIGPMAQDFKAAFDLGADDKSINFIDGQGVLFQAVKELMARVRQLEAQLQSK